MGDKEIFNYLRNFEEKINKKLSNIERSALTSEGEISEIKSKMERIEGKIDDLKIIGDNNRISIDELIKKTRFISQ